MPKRGVRSFKDFSIDDKDFLDATCLMKASIGGHIEVVSLLLTFGANPRVINKKGETALSKAVKQENLEVCIRLLVSKA